MANSKPTPKKTTAKKATPKKAVAKKAPSKKVPAKKAASVKKSVAKKAATKKAAPAKKASAKVAKAATGSREATTPIHITDIAEQVWDAFNDTATTSTANISATVNGKVIYANDVKPAALRKRFLAWFKK
jgi:hypothetical protein